MTRVNTLNDIADIYSESVLADQNVISENEVVSKKHKPNDDLETEKKVTKEPTKDTGPKAAEGYEEKVVEAGGTGPRDEKNHYSSGKTANESINNSKMTKNKSIFDKLYEDVLGGDDDELDMDMGMDMDLGDEDEEGLGEDEVTVTLPRDVAQQLCDMLKAQLEDGEGEEDMEDIEDLDGGEDDVDDSIFQETPDAQELGDAGPKGSDLDKGNLKGKNNKVPGKGPIHSKASGGHGDGKLKGGNPEPTPLGDKSAVLQGKNNKVPGHIKGKDQDFFS